MLGALGPNSFYVFELHGSYVNSTTNPRPQATNTSSSPSRKLPKVLSILLPFGCTFEALDSPESTTWGADEGPKVGPLTVQCPFPIKQGFPTKKFEDACQD